MTTSKEQNQVSLATLCEALLLRSQSLTHLPLSLTPSPLSPLSLRFAPLSKMDLPCPAHNAPHSPAHPTHG